MVVDLDADANVEAAVVAAAMEGRQRGRVLGACQELAAVQRFAARVAGQVPRRRVAVLEAEAVVGAREAVVRAVLGDDGVVPAGHGDVVGRGGLAAVAWVLVEQAQQRLVRVRCSGGGSCCASLAGWRSPPAAAC